MDHIIRIGMDTSKHVFQLHGVNAAEEPVLRRKLRRNDMVLLRKSGEFPVSNEELDDTATTVYEGI